MNEWMKERMNEHHILHTEAQMRWLYSDVSHHALKMIDAFCADFVSLHWYVDLDLKQYEF